eukprot:4427174-Amphidinium_carterae.1
MISILARTLDHDSRSTPARRRTSLAPCGPCCASVCGVASSMKAQVPSARSGTVQGPTWRDLPLVHRIIVAVAA